MRPRPSQKMLERRVREFNERHPVGTPVVTFKLMYPLREPGPRTRTRTAAFVLEGHSPVVWVEGLGGCVHLDAIQVLKEERKAA